VGYRVQISYNNSQTSVLLDTVSIKVSFTPPPPLDTTNPTTPGNLRVTSKTTSSISLAWNVSTDSGGSGLAGYKIYRDGSYIWSTTSTSFTNIELSSGTSYNFYVRAYDNAVNHSGNSNTVTAATSSLIPDLDPDPNPPLDSGGETPLPLPGGGLPSLPTAPIGNEIDPNIVNFLKINLLVPFLLGDIKSPLIVGGFVHDLELKPGLDNYEVDVRGAKFPLGKDLKIQIGGNKTLVKKLKINTKATKQSIKFGNLYLGDVNRDNKIDHKDIESYIEDIVNQQKSSDVNADGVVNSFDWAIMLANFGKVGSK